jgi:hypothetical protein
MSARHEEPAQEAPVREETGARSIRTAVATAPASGRLHLVVHAQRGR